MMRLCPSRQACKGLVFLGVCLAVLAASGAGAPWAAAGAPAASGAGSALIGTLEGPEVITDPAQFPKKFSEASQLAALVKAGKLPPVAERIGQDPLVIKPVHQIGKYGGTWRRGFSGPADFWNGFRCCGHDHILFWDYTGNAVVPNVAMGWEVTDGGRTINIFLRKGMKWSDGHPFTADDFVFWYEDMYLNEELVPTKTAVMSINGKPGAMEKVDDFTVRFKFQDPYYVFPDVLAGSTALGGHSYAGGDLKTMGGFAPKHYLKQFHPKYAGKDAVDQMVKAGGYDNWVSLFKFKNDWELNPDLPVVTPWKTTSPINTPTWVLERNPYFYMVDTAGNQLPYIDRVVLTLAENLEVLNLRAIAGEYDFQARHIDIGKLPVLLENQQRGGYKVYLDPADSGCDACLFLSQTYDADPEIAKWLQNRDFRIALSLGIDRDQLNEAFWLGLGTPGSQVLAESSPYNPGPEYRMLNSTHEPDKANQILDGLGLTKKDAEGYRLRSDGRGRLRIEIMTVGGQFLQFTQIAEMIREHWKKIGIQADVSEVERSLAITRNAGNQTQAHLWQNDGTEHFFTFPGHLFPSTVAGLGGSSIGASWAQWFLSNGTQGQEPSPRMRELMGLWRKAFGAPLEERINIGKQMWRIAVEEQWAIGTVGLSPAAQGVRVVSVKMGNIPGRQYNSPDGMTPATSLPATFFFRQ
jgi:peptide/nickel transport system substrate-binding protein